MAAVAVLVFAGVTTAGVLVARRAAEREAVNDALSITTVLAQSVVQPVLSDALVGADPAAAAAARRQLDVVVRERLLSDAIIRVKLWAPDGRIVYSDEPRLIGRTFPLGEEETDVLTSPETRSEISDLGEPENEYERRFGSRLLEVYRPVWLPSGEPLLFETYSRYTAVTARSAQLARAFGGITLSSMLLLLVAQAPLTWALVNRVRRAQQAREAALARAVSASDEERRRVAASLHDGPVQELAASAFLVAGAADRARSRQDATSAAELDQAAAAVRAGIGSLRSLLVDIYPPSLRAAGLAAALNDLVAGLRARDLRAELDVPPELDLPPAVEELVFRAAQEAVRNVLAHADADLVTVRVNRDGGSVVLEVADDGVGFHPPGLLADLPEGHFGIRLTADLAAAEGGRLLVRSAPGTGTSWRLEVPLP